MGVQQDRDGKCGAKGHSECSVDVARTMGSHGGSPSRKPLTQGHTGCRGQTGAGRHQVNPLSRITSSQASDDLFYERSYGYGSIIPSPQYGNQGGHKEPPSSEIKWLPLRQQGSRTASSVSGLDLMHKPRKLGKPVAQGGTRCSKWGREKTIVHVEESQLSKHLAPCNNVFQGFSDSGTSGTTPRVSWSGGSE